MTFLPIFALFRPFADLVPKWHHYARLLNSPFHKGEAMLDTTKERISSRVPKPVRKTLEEAAALSGATLNQFVVQAALKEAHAVLERERFVRLSRRDAEVFFKALENPPKPNARLRKAVAAYRRSALNAPD